MKPVAVIDVETTGLNPYRHDRVVEVAVVKLLPDGLVPAELTTLVNPERDVGPTSIHGLTASDVIHAPRFVDVAAHLAEFLGGAGALVGHNVRFDVSFLQAEFGRLGVEMPAYTTIDTMRLAGGGTLLACCADHGIEYRGRAHSALNDARATAALLQKLSIPDPGLYSRCQEGASPVWSRLPERRGRLVSRADLATDDASAPSYVRRLAERLSRGSIIASQPEGERDYRELLWRALEDGVVEESESDALVDVAMRWGLAFSSIEAIHQEYLSMLAKAAWADGRVTDVELREIRAVGRLLGFGKLTNDRIDELLRSCHHDEQEARPNALHSEDWSGKRVCFTGECSCCIDGRIITRETAERLAAVKGLVVTSGVTRKLDILVVSDPSTQSGKAKKARDYGIRVLHEPVFWRMLGIRVD